jgi:hypothetical protein
MCALKMVCRDICERYRAKKHRRGSYYAEGFKRCTVCSMFISWRGIDCPCCKSVLRTSPRGIKNRGAGSKKKKGMQKRGKEED